MQYSLRIEKPHYTISLYIVFLLLKIVLEYSYAYYLHVISPLAWPLHFNSLKYVYGFLWLTLLFFGISHTQKLASSFFLQFVFVFQIIPITVIYAFTNESTLYYSVVCFSVAMCEWTVSHMKTIHTDIRVENISQGRAIIWGFFALVLLFLLYVYSRNGLPTLMALNIYDVYKLRSSGIYQIGKYAGYLQALLTKVMIPILLTKFLIDKRYGFVAILIGFECVLYLYTGHKSQFFMLFLVVGTVFLAMREKFAERFWRLYCGGLSLISLAAILEVPFAYHIYSLFVRRVLFVPAQLSFYYYDFFTTHPLLGMSGIFPRWLFNFPDPYEGIDSYTYQIGCLYLRENTHANNGFLSEGFMRFGFGGIILNLVLFALVLKLIDGLQAKAGYAFAVGGCVNIIYGLGNGYLFELFGYIGAWVLFMILYQSNPPFVVRNAPRKNLGRMVPRLTFGRRI